MKQYALWKRISAYSIVIFLVSLLTFVIIYNKYVGNTLQERELRRYRQNCEQQISNINKLFLSVRNFAYDAIYAEDSLSCMEQALENPEAYQMPDTDSLAISALMDSQDYAQNVMLFTRDNIMYLKAGIAADNEAIVDDFLVGEGRQPTESWSNRRFIKREFPYNDSVTNPCISYYRVITRLKSAETVGYCRIDIPEYSLSAVYNTSDGSTAMLVDQDGMIQSASSNTQAGSSMQRLFGAEVADAILQNGQMGAIVKIDGADHYVVCRKVSRIGWMYVSIIPLGQLTYYSKYMTSMLVILMTGGSLIFIAIQTLSTRLITKPLNELASEMDRICSSHGEDVLLPQTANETQMLRRSFDNMRSRIEYMTERVYAAQIEELNAKLRYLQTQMNPHFLYNTLDAIRFSARLNADVATAEQIEALSSIYRSITQDNVYETVRQSLQITRDFALIMQNQQDRQITIHENIQQDLLDQIIPKLMIQPLVENCYQHGFRQSERDVGNIWLSVVEEAGRIVIEVQDDGVGVEDPELLLESLTNGKGGQLALKNIHARAQLYFGKAHGIRIQKRPGGGTIIRVELPDRKEMDKLK